MAAVETEIFMALKARVEAMPLAYDMSWPGEVYEPGSDPFIAVGEAITAPRRLTIKSGPHDRTGTLILSFCALMGKPSAWYREKAGIIARHFATDQVMVYGSTSVRIMAASHVQDGYRDDKWWRVPVIVRWQSYS